ncbi:TMEM165/GDT1 family protein [Arsenicicoccus dermatophilus]|uniref:TMEM165/GDT1 family protein n=1 Tax=Arsenicicoccus dermatophilus TaxID=1076331 RepID=UPI001F4CF260|nr:TMEM165/GDT1 family protein [Arsenicicoccus dermatophilus]
MLDVGIVATVFALIFVGELPDKSALASLVLGTRYPWFWAFSGVAAAFATHVVIAVAAGSVMTLLPQTLLKLLVAGLFLLGAVLIWREGAEDEAAELAEEEAVVGATDAKAGFAKVASMGYGIIFLAEWGDLTQIMTANLAAKYHSPVSVGIGAVLGLGSVALLAILGGQALLTVIPMRAITRIAAVVMVALSALTLWEAFG